VIEVVALRAQWTQESEQIRWVVNAGGKYLFDVGGLDSNGDPKKGVGARLARGAGSAAGVAVLGAVSGGGGDDLYFRDAPAVVVAGASADCAAAGMADAYRTCGGRAVWVLTDRRFALVRISEAQQEDSGGSLLERARRVGAGLWSREESEPEQRAAAVAPEVEQLAEWPPSAIAHVEAVSRKLGKDYQISKAQYLKVVLADGSGLELAPAREEADIRRLVAMSSGQA